MTHPRRKTRKIAELDADIDRLEQLVGTLADRVAQLEVDQALLASLRSRVALMESAQPKTVVG